ncbi:MAG TPA: phage holin family protein [Pseudolabrys sp.]|jgi:hypothetical protein|nr:phage holin family protein [Pseudolabrys sp.]
MPVSDGRPVSELFADALNQFSKLLRNEIRLARAEFSMKVSRATIAVGMLAGAVLFLIATLVLLLLAFAAWMIEIGLAVSVGCVVAGGLGLLIVAILGAIGLNRLKADSLVPNRTMDQLQQDAAAVREHI